MVPPEQRRQLYDWAAANKFALFPIAAWCKRPTGVVASHARDWSLDPAQWETWYMTSGGCNYGVSASPSRLIVVDVDADGEGRPYFDAFWLARVQKGELCVATPRGGWHIYCRLPDSIDDDCVHQPDWLKHKINVRARNGYVVAPFCQTRAAIDDGVADGSYRLSGYWPQVAPSELISHCIWAPAPAVIAPPPLTDIGPDGYPTNPVERLKTEHQIARIVGALREAVPGERNNRLNEAAFALGRLAADGAADGSVLESLAAAEGEALGLSREEARATARSGFHSGVAAGPDRTQRTALDALLAAAVPTQPRITIHPSLTSAGPAEGWPEPVVERLLYEGCVTTLSGHGGSGKTTIGASLMAAAAAGVRDYAVGGFGAESDVLARPASWVFVSYEGGQFIDLHMRAWRAAAGRDGGRESRCRVVTRRGPLVYLAKREPVVDEIHARQIVAAIDEARAVEPDLPVVLAVDNVTSAIEDSTDPVQAVIFMRAMRALADTGAAILLFAHPPKRGGAAIYGAHQLFSLADIVCELEVIRRDDRAWVQWLSFDKHRPAANGMSLEMTSRRLDQPLMDLPVGWGGGNERARARALRDLCAPWISQIRVRPDSEKESAKSGVRRVDAIVSKEAVQIPVAPSSGAAIHQFAPRKI